MEEGAQETNPDNPKEKKKKVIGLVIQTLSPPLTPGAVLSKDTGGVF